MPADQILGTRRGVVIPGRRPQHPALAIGVRKERHQLVAVTQAIPADGAVAESGDHDPAVARDVDAPGGARVGDLPTLVALTVVEAQIPVGAEHEALTIGSDGEAACLLVGLERQLPPVELGITVAAVVGDLDPGRGPDRRIQATAIVGQRQRPARGVEARRRATEELIAEMHRHAVIRQAKFFVHVAQIGNRALHGAHAHARGVVHAPQGLGGAEDNAAGGKRVDIHDRIGRRL